ncbi:MAG: hypothetical protein ROR55_06355 [Devosia sp.]
MEMIKWLESWTKQAIAEIDPPKGRPRHDAERALVADLREAWIEQTGSAPGITRDSDSGEGTGPFLELCRDLARPINELMGQKPPDLDAIAKEVLAEKAREKGAQTHPF